MAERKAFNKIKTAMELPDLVEIQKRSYDWFLHEGLKELFTEISPVRDFIGRDLELTFGKYSLDEPKFDEVTSKKNNLSFEAPLRVMVKLVNKKFDNKEIEQEVYLGDFPLMTDRGTFIINGIERVVVSQLIRSAGVFFTSEYLGDRRVYGAKIIPNRGSWLEFETDQNGVIWVKIDRKRKIAATSLLRAFGHGSDEEIKKLFEQVDSVSDLSYIDVTLEKDPSQNEAEALKEVYKRIRPGDMATADNAKSLIYSMFFNFDRYDFDRVGRYKINQRFGQDTPITPETRVLMVEDIVAVMREIISLNISQKDPDDIDHLGNRRVRAVGELIQNKFRIGLARMERIAKDRMSTMDIAEVTPNRLINARPVIGAVKEFFMSSQLSQFMDQTNPLSELEHKRRLSAMGPGGLSRERAGFDVRDVHPTHYGRICPIATPEGPNIGLVGHLASYALVNEYGFIETPYRKVIHDPENKVKLTTGEMAREDITDAGGKVLVKENETISAAKAKELEKLTDRETIPVVPRVTDDIIYLTAFQSSNVTTTAATTPIDDQGRFINKRAEVRKKSEPGIEYVEFIDYMDVAPNQIVSVTTSLIPFLEHDDAVRALMGSNMQRQAVTLVNPSSPIVGTGMEGVAARDSGHMLLAPEDGTVTKVQGDLVEMVGVTGKTHSFPLNKFVRSNASTCINQHPAVAQGAEVKRGDVLADGAATDDGELALGQNITCAFMAWEGYNFEDAIIVSERLVRDDLFTSIYLEDFQIEVRDTKLGPEVITSDIPNIGEEKLKDLDAEGVVRIGASVSSGSILVGKITPKGETELSAEEKLLRAIFGEKARDVRDSSLYLEHGEKGKVVDIKVFSRANGDKLSSGVITMIQISIANMRKIQVGDKMAGRHGNKGVVSIVLPVEDMPFLEDGTPIDIILSPLGVVSRMNLGQILETHLGLAANKLGYKIMSPVFDGVTEAQIKQELTNAGFAQDGKMTVFDGRSGEEFDERVTVGQIYMLKLNHMIEDKIHQRSIGPYSLITQQPLGGKAQFGGQRFGEMEVWSLEAYGAAHTLQEILTIKSDDIVGRSKAYESIIKGEPIRKLNVPESFNVLLRELNGLGLNVELVKAGKPVVESETESADEESAVEEKVDAQG